MTKTFEDYLKDIHAKSYHGTDDNMPDAFEAWLGGMDIDDIMKYADEFAEAVWEEAFKQGRDIGMRIDMTNKDIQEQVKEFESYLTPPSLDYMSSWLRQALITAEQRGAEKERKRVGGVVRGGR